MKGIAVDAAHSAKARKTEYQGVDLSTGKYLFYKDMGNQTVNIGEFMAIVEAAKYIVEHNFKPRVIYSDSITAIGWFKAKETSSIKKRNKHLMKGVAYLKACSSYLDGIEIRHWNSVKWGENPADFGNK